MAHGALSRDPDGAVVCALPAGLAATERIVAARYAHGPWQVAVIGRRAPRRLALDDDGQTLLAYVPVTGFAKPLQTEHPSVNFAPTLIREQLLLPLAHPAQPGAETAAWRAAADGGWVAAPVYVGDPVDTGDAPYRLHGLADGPPPTPPAAAPKRRGRTAPAETEPGPQGQAGLFGAAKGDDADGSPTAAAPRPKRRQARRRAAAGE